MSIQFRQALTYPFRSDNRKAMIWLPGAFGYGLFTYSFLMGILIVVMGGDPSHMMTGWDNPTVLLLNLVFQLTQLVLQLAGSALGLGYCWWLMARLQQYGQDTPGPGWLEDLPRLLLDGLKATLYTIVINIALAIPILLFVGLLVVLFIMVLSVGFHENQSAWGILGFFLLALFSLAAWIVGFILLGPFLLAPMLCSAKTRDLGDLFNLARAWKQATNHYRSAVTSMLYIVLLFLLYGIGLIILVIGTLGLGLLALPFLMFAPYVSMVHLAVQGLPCESTVDHPPT